jgi:hypothetical protein
MILPASSTGVRRGIIGHRRRSASLGVPCGRRAGLLCDVQALGD